MQTFLIPSGKADHSQCMKTAGPYLTADMDAVIEVPPLVRTKRDLQGVGEPRDESILDRQRQLSHERQP